MKKNILYYVGRGVCYGTCVGVAIGIFKVEMLGIFMFLGIAFGAIIGAIYGKSKKDTSTKK